MGETPERLGIPHSRSCLSKSETALHCVLINWGSYQAARMPRTVERPPTESFLLRVLNAILPWFVILLAIIGSMVFGGGASNPVKPMPRRAGQSAPLI
jgi:hypothetical protein